MSSSVPPQRTPGRPREFDMDVVLDKAITVFSRLGYSATSVADLNTALGLTSGSIYKAFGDKRGVLMAALDRYVERRTRRLDDLLASARTGRERVAAVLKSYAETSHGETGRTGCLVIGTLMEFAGSDPALRERLTKILATHEARLLRFLREGHADGSIAARIDPEATARLLLCVIQGMRVVGKSGRRQAEMAAICIEALRLLD
ncbi:TetR/AcrR family transcriptional regulator [Bradyrhizobium ontarionense]|uniref:TetR/AcrR family transcriptional regulator n=1 Tax=Bradyrhizobium ontarionense TaxID=2898149 RepID=A0ABY3RJW9_9BRAD|nr:TetR/AcrR family transcriptional regulator [Bradyrhizobium sp. A19]UFZ07745.1 TetR/AcrR family transcriptional regulator [Bradyrhizobium sp. A19]